MPILDGKVAPIRSAAMGTGASYARPFVSESARAVRGDGVEIRSQHLGGAIGERVTWLEQFAAALGLPVDEASSRRRDALAGLVVGDWY